MTLSISQPAFDELLGEMTAIAPTKHPDLQDNQDQIYQYSPTLGKGKRRTIRLRDGLELTLGNLHLNDRILTTSPERISEGIEYHLHLSGEHQDNRGLISSGEYGLYGEGLALNTTFDCSSREPLLGVDVWMDAALFRSFVGDADRQLPTALQPLIRPVEQVQYARMGKATPQMQTVARQILQCPYQGIAKRMYLEGKALELISMMVAEEIEIAEHQSIQRLKADLVDQVHHAKDILLQRTANPPTLAELARLSGLNEYSLKCGFRQVFGMTVFSYLHDHNMKQAKQLLQTGAWKVEEVSQMVGYANLSAFGRAFRKQFGQSPRDCRLKVSV